MSVSAKISKFFSAGAVLQVEIGGTGSWQEEAGSDIRLIFEGRVVVEATAGTCFTSFV